MKRSFLYSLILILLSSCSLIGIHVNTNYPKKPGKLPKFDQETILLGELSPLRSCYDVHFYDLDLSFFPDDKTIKGKVQIKSMALTDFDRFQMDLDQQFAILEIKDLTNGSILNFERKERAIYISRATTAGSNLDIEIAYEGKPMKAKKAPWKGGFVWDKDKKGNPWLGVACESDGASVWWPLKDHTSDEPDSVNLHYSVPKGLMAVGNGQYAGKDEHETNDTYHWKITYPINTYNITVYVGNLVEIKDTYKGIEGQDLLLSHYVLAGNEEKARKHFQQLHPILKVFEEKFGPYPFYNDGFKLVESPYAGMEHQTAIAYGNGYKNQLEGKYDYIILHETAHEWWGNSVTARDMSDVWIQEGFATYAESMFLEEAEGMKAMSDHLFINRIMIKNQYPVKGIEDRRWFHFRKGSDVYVKGAWILQTLRHQIADDELFFEIIRSFAMEYKYQLVDSQDFIDWVSVMTDEDYNWFFKQYLTENYVPKLIYGADVNGAFYYRWDYTLEDFNQLKVDLIVTNGDTIQLTPTAKFQYYQLPVENDAWRFQLLNNILYGFEEDKSI